MVRRIFNNLRNKTKQTTRSGNIYGLADFNILKIKNINDFKNINEKSFVDIPASIPKNPFYLEKVGVTNRKHKIKIRDIFEDNKIIEVEADIKIFFDLPENQRGLHMSRIEKAMQEFQNAGTDLKTYAQSLIKYAAELQNRKGGEIEVEFNYEKTINKNSSGRLAHEILKILFYGKLKEDNKFIYKLGIKAPFMNACPCPQRWAIREFYNKLKELGFKNEEIYELASHISFGTHTNLGEATLCIEDLNNNINYQDLYEILDETLSITRELLSGQDEFEFIKEALIKEQFCEDAARDLVYTVVKNLKNKIHPESLIEIYVEVNESIHFHNLRVEIVDNFKHILDKIEKLN